jgi:hypothetical protein
MTRGVAKWIYRQGAKNAKDAKKEKEIALPWRSLRSLRLGGEK